jgi:hypothetical protein
MKRDQVRTSGLGRTRFSLALGCCAAALSAFSAGAASASESGASIYLLGSGGPGAGALPPIRGVFFANTIYYYDSSLGGGKSLPLGGKVVADVDATILANFATVLWVPSTNLGGATVALGAALPIGQPSIDASVVLTGPGGNQIDRTVSDEDVLIGDPLLTAAVGWKAGKVSFSASGLLNVPIGQYREGALANLSFNRWAGDASLAATWKDKGWDVSGKAGLTANGENEATLYTTGTEFHLEGAIEKTLSKTWSAGLQAYHFDQLSGDSGPGAVLGPFKGRVSGVGATAAYNFEIGRRPASLRLHAFKEFDAKNRPEGTAVFLDFTIPLKLVMPPGA